MSDIAPPSPATDKMTGALVLADGTVFWGKGIGSAVCSALVSWAHSAASIVRVQATVLESNARSIAVLERCGFAREGLLRSYRKVRGRRGNFYMYAHVALRADA